MCLIVPIRSCDVCVWPDCGTYTRLWPGSRCGKHWCVLILGLSGAVDIVTRKSPQLNGLNRAKQRRFRSNATFPPHLGTLSLPGSAATVAGVRRGERLGRTSNLPPLAAKWLAEASQSAWSENRLNIRKLHYHGDTLGWTERKPRIDWVREGRVAVPIQAVTWAEEWQRRLGP